MPHSLHYPLPPEGGRILSLDIARGFTVFIMPAVHVVMLYSHPSVQQSLPGDILAFLAEGPGAQVLMLIMGVSLSLHQKTRSKKVLQRTFYLLSGAFALNLYKLVIPLELEFIPQQLVTDMAFANPSNPALSFLLMGDIFHFAAIAYPLTWLLSKAKHYRLGALGVSITIMLLSPYIWDVKTQVIFVDQLLVYFNGHPPQAFFPVFPWLVYPMAGLIIGPSIQSKTLLPIGCCLLIFSLCLPATLVIPNYPSHYRTGFADTIFHLGIVLTWIPVINWVVKRMRMNFISRLLIFCSRHISLYYVIQWLLIFWCLPLAAYQQLDLYTSTVWITVITLASIGLTKLICYVPRRKSL